MVVSRHIHRSLADSGPWQYPRVRSRADFRLAFYSHDSFGLGHISRTLAVAREVLGRVPHARIRLLTGSPVSWMFLPPAGCDVTTIPPITKDRDGRYVARDTDLSPAEIHAIRGGRALEALRGFEPDLLLVDHQPAGAGNELLPVLEELRALRPDCRIVLGMRDIIDTPERVRERFDRDGTLSLLEKIYDAIMVYGCREIFDPIREYGFPESIARKIVFTGYLGRRPVRRIDPVPGSVLLTVGGGEDGGSVLEAYLRDVRDEEGGSLRPSLLVTGPLLPDSQFRRLRELSRGLRGIRLVRFVPDLQAAMARAEVVVTRAGYNTLCESLELGPRLVVVPRRRFRREQEFRARLFAERGILRSVVEDPPPPGALLETVRARLEEPRRDRPVRRPEVLRMNGLEVTGRVLTALLAPEPSRVLRTGDSSLGIG